MAEFQYNTSHMLWWVLSCDVCEHSRRLREYMEQHADIRIEVLDVHNLLTAYQSVERFVPTDATDMYYKLSLAELLKPMIIDQSLAI